jgi:dTDP-glucose 4,6-dehydratase
MPTAVVTGGAGFLGSHLCDALVAKGFRVICVDNLDTGSLQNVEHLRGDDFLFINQDVTLHLEIEEPVDFVYHLAALASPIDYLRMPLHSLKVGTGRTTRWASRSSSGLASSSPRRARCTAILR